MQLVDELGLDATDEYNWLYLFLPHEKGDGERFANGVRAKIRQP